MISKSRLQESGRTLDVPIKLLQVGPEKIQVPWLDPYDMVRALAKHRELEWLGADCNLLEWWRRFARIEPNHWVFTAAACGEVNLARCIPTFSHGDEGRGKKRKVVLIWSMRGCVGQGTDLHRATHDEASRLESMGLNMGAGGQPED